MRWALLLVLCTLNLAMNCSPTPGPAPVPSKYTCSDAANNLASVDNGTCADADGILYSKPNKKGEMFVDTCNNQLAIHVPVPVTCLATAKTCTEAKQCR